MQLRDQQTLFYAGLCIVFVALATVALAFDGTGGGGDSVFHFLIARFSWKHPELFLHHWGKPLFTMLASPFAQLGFKGVKFFNVVVTVLACHFAYRTAKQLQMPNAAWIVLFYFMTPETIEVTISGLTEPLFALVLIMGIYFLTAGKSITGTIILSFLPFSRSEGLIILCVLLVYLLFTKQFKALPWLLFGHLFMGVAGIFVYRDVLWVFNKIPYARLASDYGHGHWDHFIKSMYYITGPVLWVLSLVGLPVLLFRFREGFWAKLKDRLFLDKLFLIYGMFIVFFIGHSAFWALGIFGSAGLSRVIIGIIPVFAVMCLEGLNTLYALLDHYKLGMLRRYLAVLLLGGMVFYCFFCKPTRLDYKHNFVLNEDQQMMAELAPYIDRKFPGYTPYFSDASFSYFLDIDQFTPKGEYLIRDTDYGNKLQEKELIIWDGWRSKRDERIDKRVMLDNPNLKLDTSFRLILGGTDTIDYLIFVRR